MEPTAHNWPLDRATKLRVLERVIEAESFENFLHTRFVGHKRFSLELTIKAHETKRITCPKCGSRVVKQEITPFFAITSHKG